MQKDTEHTKAGKKKKKKENIYKSYIYIFGRILYLAEIGRKNLQSARDLERCKSGRAITCLVDVIIYCTIFQKQFSISPPTSPVLRKKYFKKKLAMENAD